MLFRTCALVEKENCSKDNKTKVTDNLVWRSICDYMNIGQHIGLIDYVSFEYLYVC